MYPSPSSSVSVTSGVPSLSVSLCTVISTVFVTFDPSGFVTTTGTSNVLVSSFGPQFVTAGVPLIVFEVGSYVTPFGSLDVSTVTVALLLPGVITTFVIGFPSTIVCVGFEIVVGATGVITAAGLELAFLGSEPFAISSASVYPSPSSSVSVTSGIPSLSVSLCTVISTVFVTFDPSGFVTTTGTSNVFVSSFGPQLVTAGVPLIVFEVGSYVTPFGSLDVSTVTVALLLPGVITTFVIGFPSTIVCVGFEIVVGATGVITAAGLELAFLGSEPFAISSASVYPSPSSSVSVTSGIPSLSVSL